MTNPIDQAIQRLRECAERATPGPWYVDHRTPAVRGGDVMVYLTERKGHGRIARMWAGRSKEDANAKYIAMVPPEFGRSVAFLLDAWRRASLGHEGCEAGECEACWAEADVNTSIANLFHLLTQDERNE